MLGRTLGSYRLVRKVGQGGMGAVYEAQHTSDGGRAAVKVLLRHATVDPQAAARFFNEAKAISMVSHPCLVKIIEYGNLPGDGRRDGEAYIVMEYLDGETLRARLTGQYLGESCIHLMRQLASALAATHRKRIVHRDLKPDNIMLIADPQVPGGVRPKILDFGIAKLLPDMGAIDTSGEIPLSPSQISQPPSSSSLPSQSSYPSSQSQPSGSLPPQQSAVPQPARMVKTRAGLAIGTPTYMSPEQCRAATAPDARTDVYSLGIIFYQLLYGEPPFVSDSTAEMYGLHMFTPPPDLQTRVPALQPKLAALVHRMLDKKPAGRPSMRALGRALSEIADTGLADGPRDSAPCFGTGARRDSVGLTSGIIRQQLRTQPMVVSEQPTLQSSGALPTTGARGPQGGGVPTGLRSRRVRLALLGCAVGLGVALIVLGAARLRAGANRSRPVSSASLPAAPSSQSVVPPVPAGAGVDGGTPTVSPPAGATDSAPASMAASTENAAKESGSARRNRSKPGGKPGGTKRSHHRSKS